MCDAVPMGGQLASFCAIAVVTPPLECTLSPVPQDIGKTVRFLNPEAYEFAPFAKSYQCVNTLSIRWYGEMLRKTWNGFNGTALFGVPLGARPPVSRAAS